MQVADNKSNKILAKDLKVIIANYINDHYGKVDLTTEVMYGSSRKVVDMMFIYKDNLYGIEIKSEGDNTSRLPGQLKEYEKLFDYILVFSSESHLKSISKLITDNVGLFYVKDDSVFRLRRPLKNAKTEKKEMLSTIPSTVIKQYFKITGSLNSDEIRSQALRNSRKVIHQLLISYFKQTIPNRLMTPAT